MRAPPQGVEVDVHRQVRRARLVEQAHDRMAPDGASTRLQVQAKLIK